MASFGDGKIEAYVGPLELGAADNLEQVIVDFIGGAKKTLDIAIQEIDSRTIAQAILDARWRGVRVQMFIEQDYVRSELRGTPPASPTPLPGETPAQALERVQWLRDDTDLAINRQILAALLRSDIEVKGDYNPKIFHQKFILRDYDGSAVPTSALLTGSANFTTTDTHRNLNNLVIFRSAYVCRQYLTEVEQLKRGSFGRGMHGAAPATYDLGGVPVRVLFAPDHTPELEIVKQILKGSEAQPEECYFAIFTFAGSSGIDDALLAMARGGMKVHGVLDRGQAATLSLNLKRARTYAERMFRHVAVGNLEPDAAGDALAIPLAGSGRSFGLSLIGEICEQTAGYPYFLQFLAAFACSRIGLEHIELDDFARVEAALLHELDLAFFEDRFEAAPQSEQQVLVAMARQTGRATLRRIRDEVAEAPNVDLLVRRLIERGLVYRTGRATYDFALPLFRGFIRRRRKLSELTGSVSGGTAAREEGR